MCTKTLSTLVIYAAREPAALLRAVRLERALDALGRRRAGGEEAPEERVLRFGAALLGGNGPPASAEMRRICYIY